MLKKVKETTIKRIYKELPKRKGEIFLKTSSDFREV